MTYYVEVTVRSDFKSREEAEAFADKVLESTKGADYSKNIRYVNNAKFNRLTSFTINNPVLLDR